MITAEPTPITASTGNQMNAIDMRNTARVRSVFPNGPPLIRGAPAAAAASEMRVGQDAAVIATKAAASAGTEPVCQARMLRAPNGRRSETRSPISLRTNPNGRLTPLARATAPSRFAPASRPTRPMRTSGHRHTRRPLAATPANATPTAVNASGDHPRLTATVTNPSSCRVNHGFAAYRPRIMTTTR